VEPLSIRAGFRIWHAATVATQPLIQMLTQVLYMYTLISQISVEPNVCVPREQLTNA
jgi:hypothetical protein